MAAPTPSSFQYGTTASTYKIFSVRSAFEPVSIPIKPKCVLEEGRGLRGAASAANSPTWAEQGRMPLKRGPKMRLVSMTLAGMMFVQTALWAIPHSPPELKRIRGGRQVKITTVDGDIAVGRVSEFDGCRVRLDSEPADIECGQIRSVEVVKQPKPARPPRMASSLTGTSKAILLVAGAAAMVLVLGLIAAHNTK